MPPKQPGASKSGRSEKKFDESVESEEKTSADEMSHDFQEEAQSTSDQPDDLTRIKGVNEEIAEAFRQIGIDRYDELADYNADRLGNFLKAQEPPITLAAVKLESIIEQAKKLSAPRSATIAAQPPSQAAPATQPASKKRLFDKHWRADEWAEVADFFVSFGYEITQTGEKVLQTRAIHYEGETERKWTKIAQQELLDWMVEIANRALLPEDRIRREEPMATATGASSPPARQPLTLSISDLKVAKIAAAAESGAKSADKVRVEATVKITGRHPESSSAQRALLFEVYLVDAQTQHSRMAAYQTTQPQSDQSSCPIRMEFTAPQSGSHALYVTAQELPFGEKTYIQGPDLRVE